MITRAPSGIPIPSPSPQVTKAEEAYLKQIKSSGLPDLSTLQITDGVEKFPRRPGFGTKGNPVQLWANYFEFIPPPDLILHRYSVTVTEKAGGKGSKDVTGKKLQQTFRLLLEQPPFQGHRNDIVTDFKANLVSRIKFDTKDVPGQIQYRREGEDEPLINAAYHNIAIVPTGTVTVSELTDYLTSTNPRAVLDKQPFLQALNIFLGHYTKASPDYACIGSSRSFPVNPNNASDLGAGLRAVRGFFSSVRVATSRILVNVNVSHAPFYDPVPLVQSMQVFGGAHQFDKIKLQAFLKRVRVEAKHIKPKTNKAGRVIPRVKTIFALATKNDGRGVDSSGTAPRVREFGAGPKDVEFWLDEAPTEGSSKNLPAPATGKSSAKKGKGKPEAPAGGRYISVAEHFLNNYRMQTNAKIPVVNVGTTAKPSYLPAEACLILPGQSSQAKLDPQQTQAMIAFAVRSPWLNARSIDQDGPNEVGLIPQINGDISRFRVTVNPRMITVPGRILDSPKVKYGTQGVNMFPASWNMENAKRQPLQFNTRSTLTSWRALVLNVDRVGNGLRSPQELADVMAAFYNALRTAGINAQRPEQGRGVAMTDPNDPALEDALKAVKEQLCLVVLPSKHTVLYNRKLGFLSSLVPRFGVSQASQTCLSSIHPNYMPSGSIN